MFLFFTYRMWCVSLFAYFTYQIHPCSCSMPHIHSNGRDEIYGMSIFVCWRCFWLYFCGKLSSFLTKHSMTAVLRFNCQLMNTHLTGTQLNPYFDLPFSFNCWRLLSFFMVSATSTNSSSWGFFPSNSRTAVYLTVTKWIRFNYYYHYFVTFDYYAWCCVSPFVCWLLRQLHRHRPHRHNNFSAYFVANSANRKSAPNECIE